MNADHTAEGTWRLATSQHRGNVGIRTGSTARKPGRTHIFDTVTERTLCGRRIGSMVEHLIDFPLDELPVRRPMCSACMAVIA